MRLVGFGGLPVPLPDDEIELMRLGLSQSGGAEPHPFLAVGRRVALPRVPSLASRAF